MELRLLEAQEESRRLQESADRAEAARIDAAQRQERSFHEMEAEIQRLNDRIVALQTDGSQDNLAASFILHIRPAACLLHLRNCLHLLQARQRESAARAADERHFLAQLARLRDDEDRRQDELNEQIRGLRR